MSIMNRNKKTEYNQLRKLSRSDLLELLLEQTKKNEVLEAEIEELKTKIEEQRTALAEAGSIAESARKLNDVIEKAEKAVESYLGGMNTKTCMLSPKSQQQGKSE